MKTLHICSPIQVLRNLLPVLRFIFLDCILQQSILLRSPMPLSFPHLARVPSVSRPPISSFLAISFIKAFLFTVFEIYLHLSRAICKTEKMTKSWSWDWFDSLFDLFSLKNAQNFSLSGFKGKFLFLVKLYSWALRRVIFLVFIFSCLNQIFRLWSRQSLLFSRTNHSRSSFSSQNSFFLR